MFIKFGWMPRLISVKLFRLKDSAETTFYSPAQDYLYTFIHNSLFSASFGFLKQCPAQKTQKSPCEKLHTIYAAHNFVFMPTILIKTQIAAVVYTLANPVSLLSHKKEHYYSLSPAVHGNDKATTEGIKKSRLLYMHLFRIRTDGALQSNGLPNETF